MQSQIHKKDKSLNAGTKTQQQPGYVALDLRAGGQGQTSSNQRLFKKGHSWLYRDLNKLISQIQGSNEALRNP